MTVDRVQELKALLEDLETQTEFQRDHPDPKALAEALGVRVRFFPLGGLKGFYLVLNDIPFIAIDQDLPEALQRIVCAHELGHHLLHRKGAMDTTFNDYELYRMENRYEQDANLFAALLLIPDAAVKDLFRPENRGLSRKEAALLLGTTEELLSIRLQSEGLSTGVRFSQFPAP